MSGERWQQVERLYHDALERSLQDRAAFLQEACPDDDLRREVESLLGFDSAGTSALDGPAWETRLAAGEHLGPYELLQKIGEGGMGEVWKARDIRVGRAVAVKVCREQFSERFGREARAIGALNHPYVCTLYDVGPNYLVMEYLDGKPLKGPLPVERAIEYARQVLEALDAAHRHGIVHRDLKPSNVLVTASSIKLLDFGLAKLRSPTTATEEEMSATAELTVAGTPQYMAPEQIEGKPVDARTDIFAFGCLLHELLTGEPAFARKTVSSTMAAVLASEPVSVSKLQPAVPAGYDRIVRTCLAKDPEERFQSAREVLRALDWVREETPLQVQAKPVLLPWLVAGALAILGIAGLAVWWRGARPAERPLVRLSVDLGPDASRDFGSVAAISPGGQQLVYPVRVAGKQQLAVRALSESRATLLPETEGGRNPFFSPDGQWIGFFAGDRGTQLKKVAIRGGVATNLAACGPVGGGWSEDGDIFVPESAGSPILRVPASGGVTGDPVTRPRNGEMTHRWPQVLPGGHAVLFTSSASPTTMEDATIQVLSLKTGTTKILQRGGYYGRYAPSGHLLFIHQGTLFGVRFDIDRLEVRGTPRPLLADIASDPVSGLGQFDISGPASGSGTLVYLEGTAPQGWPLIWIESSGTRPLLRTPGIYSEFRVSPDGQRVALISSAKGSDLYIYDWRRDVMTPLTFDGHAGSPIWSPDGKHIAFRSTSDSFAIYWVRSDGAGEPEKLLQSTNNVYPSSFSPDGRLLAYNVQYEETRDDLWILPLDLGDPDHPKPGKPERLQQQAGIDNQFPKFSPDGKWIAYRSSESGSWQVYVRPYPGTGGRWLISTNGGLMAYWSRTAPQLFYRSGDARIMVVDYKVEGGSFVWGKPRIWSTVPLNPVGTLSLDLAPDGKRFAGRPVPAEAQPGTGSVHLTFLQNFFDELRRRVP